MPRLFFVGVGILVWSLTVSAQASGTYLEKEISSYTNEKKIGSLYIRNPEEVGPQDDRTGNDLAFDEVGNLYIYNYDQGVVYSTEKSARAISGFVRPDLGQRYTEYLVKVEQGLMLFNHVLGRLKATDLQGKQVFEFGRKITSFRYIDHVLLYFDDTHHLGAVISPSLDQKNNLRNVVTPGVAVDEISKGRQSSVRIGEDGSIFVNGQFASDGKSEFYPVVNEYMYILSRDRKKLWVSSKRSDVATIQIAREPRLESIAISPTGDVWILRFDKDINKHVLSVIQNSWLPEK